MDMAWLVEYANQTAGGNVPEAQGLVVGARD
jgi:hypothetical protein